MQISQLRNFNSTSVVVNNGTIEINIPENIGLSSYLLQGEDITPPGIFHPWNFIIPVCSSNLGIKNENPANHTCSTGISNSQIVKQYLVSM